MIKSIMFMAADAADRYDQLAELDIRAFMAADAADRLSRVEY